MSAKKRILLMVENITLAQVVRLATLGRALPRDRYEVHFAASSFDPMIFDGSDFIRHELYTLPKKTVFKALEAGKRLYEKRALLRYVAADLEVIERVRPDLVVSDFRLSLSTSAPLSGVTWGTMINAYFSPFAVRDGFPVPDHPIVGVLGEEMTARYFPIALPRVFDHFAAPVNAVRKKHGLRPIGSLLEVLTHADYTLYPDDPALVPLAGAPERHRFIGPVLWAPEVRMPQLPTANQGAPLVYVTLGSSGKVDVLPLAIDALSRLPVQVIVATAGRAELGELPPNMVASTFVPGDEVAKRASVVVSNGGSTTGYQALAAGTPVLGIASNLDQYMTMQAFERNAIGLTVKGRAASSQAILAGLQRLLNEPHFRARARIVGERFRRFDAGANFTAWVDDVTGLTSRTGATDTETVVRRAV